MTVGTLKARQETLLVGPTGGGASGLYIDKPADTNSPASPNETAVVDDPHLTLAVVANRIYVMQGFLEYDGDPGGDFKFIFTAPIGSSMRWSPNAPASNATATAGMAAPREVFSLTQSKTAGVPVAGTPSAAQPLGRLVIGSTAGNLKLQWAQGTAHSTPTILRAGSWLALSPVS